MALGLGITLIGGAMAASPAHHDGTWSIRMVTDSGMCDRSYNYSIAIEDGNVRYLQAPGDSPTTVSGRIGQDGNVDLDIRRSVAKVDAQGRLNGRSGSGTWRLGMLGCEGRWNAQKRA
jgi:hypothetical protein